MAAKKKPTAKNPAPKPAPKPAPRKRGRPPKDPQEVASGTDRARAARLRRYRTDGRELSAEERAFLAKYDAKHPAPARESTGWNPHSEPWHPVPGPTTAPELTPELTPAPAPERTPARAELDELDDELGDELDESGERALPEPEPEPKQAPASSPGSSIVPSSPSSCAAGPDCPECSKAASAIRCSTTGNPVYPKIGDLASKGLTGMLFGGLAFGIGAWRPDGYRPELTEWEVSETSKAVEEVMYRRANSLGAVGDLVALVGCLGAVGYRMRYEPPPANFTSPKLERAKQLAAQRNDAQRSYPRTEGDRLYIAPNVWVPVSSIQRGIEGTDAAAE